MGNCCGKASGDDSFQGQGRTLGGTAPAAAPNRAAVPSKIKATSSSTTPGAGRTLGSSAVGDEDAKTAAARAAEERAKAAQGKGKLGRQLDAQRGQTQASTLAQTARDNVAARDADRAVEARNYN